MTGAGRTTWGMYRQALRELRTRYDALVADYEQIEDLKAGIPKLRGWKQAARMARLESALATCRDRAREFAWFRGVARKLKAELGDLTPERQAQLESERWVAVLREQAAQDLQAHGRVCPGTWAAIANLPRDLKDPIVVEIVNRPKDLVQGWLENDPVIPRPEALQEAEVRALIEGAVPCR